MFSKEKIMTLFSAAAVLVLANGCIRMEYTGKTDLKPLPDDARVGIYYDQQKLPLPVDKLQKVGSVNAYASSSDYSANDMRKKIIKSAKQHGANVILFTSIEYNPNGEARSDQVRNEPSAGWSPTDNMQTNMAMEKRALRYPSGKNGEVPVYSVRMKADFYQAPADAVKRKEPALKRVPERPETQQKKVKINIL